MFKKKNLSLKALAEIIEKRRRNKCDTIIFISGETGCGKSTLAIKLARKIKKISKNKFKFSLKNNLVYSRDEVLKNIINNKNTIIVADELIGIAYKRDFYMQLQKDLVKALNLYRSNFNVFIGCIPSFGDLDKGLLERCKLHIYIPERGKAFVRTKRKSLLSTDPWFITAIKKIEYKNNKLFNKQFGRMPGVVGQFTFTELVPGSNIEKLYEELKEQRRNQVLMDDFGFNKEKSLIEEKIDEAYQMLIKKDFTKESFDIYCKGIGKNPGWLRHRLNNKLRLAKDPYKVQHYLKPKPRLPDKMLVDVMGEE